MAGVPWRITPFGPVWLVDGKGRQQVIVDEFGAEVETLGDLVSAVVHANRMGWPSPTGIGWWETEDDWWATRERWCPIVVGRRMFAREHGTPSLHGAWDTGLVGYAPDGPVCDLAAELHVEAAS